MPVDKVTIEQFAQRIKAKYPQYKDINDTLLTQKMIEKYPQYKDTVTMEQPKVETPKVDVGNQNDQFLSFGEPIKQASKVPAGMIIKPKADLSKPNIKAAIDNKVNDILKSQRGVYDKTLPKPSKEEVDKVKNDVINLYQNGVLEPSKNLKGEDTMKRGSGFWESLWDAAKQAHAQGMDDKFLMSLPKDKAIEYLNANKEHPELFNKERETAPSGVLGNIGETIGQNLELLGKATTGAVALGTTELTGAEGAGAFTATAKDIAASGYSQSLQNNYNKLKEQDPKISDEEAYDKASHAALANEAVQLGVNAVLSHSIPKLPEPSVNVNGAINAVTQSLKHTVQAAPKVVGTAAYGSLVSDYAAQQAGVNITPDEALKNLGEHGKGMAIMHFGLGALGAIANGATASIPSYLRPQLENVVASAPREEVEAYYKNAETTGQLPEGTTDKVMAKLSDFDKQKAIVDKMPITEEKKAAITGKLLQRQNLIDQREELSKYGASFNDQINKIDSRIKQTESEINMMHKADNVFQFETDTHTGESLSNGKPFDELTGREKEGVLNHEGIKNFGTSDVKEIGEGENKTFKPIATYNEKSGDVTVAKPIKIEDEGKTYTSKESAQKAADETLARKYYEEELPDNQKPQWKQKNEGVSTVSSIEDEYFMGSNKLADRISDLKSKEKKELIDAVGEDWYKKYSTATNEQKSAMENALTPEQKKVFGGVGKEGLTSEDLREFRKKVVGIESSDDIETLGSYARQAVTDIANKRNEKESVGVLNAVAKKASELGITKEDLQQATIKDLSDKVGKENAVDILNTYFNETKAQAKEPIKQAMEGEKIILNREKTPRDEDGHFSFLITDKKTGEEVGKVSFNYREDLGGYQMENIKIGKAGTKLGYETYKALISKLDKPLISDSALSQSAEHTWKKLVAEDLAKYDEGIKKYISISNENKEAQKPNIKAMEGSDQSNEPISTSQSSQAESGVPETTQNQKIGGQDAIQEPSPSSLLQHPQETIGETGSERRGMESSIEGNETTGTRSQEESQSTGEEENVTGITHALMDETAKEFGLPTYEKDPEKIQEWEASADKKLSEEGSLDKLFNKLRNGELPDAVETIMMIKYIGDLKAKIQANPTPELLDQLKRTKDLFNIAGRIWGKAGRARQEITAVEDTLPDFLLGKQTAQGAPLSENQIKEETTKFNELDKAKKELKEAKTNDEERDAKLIAEHGLNKAKAIAKKASKKTHEEHVAIRKKAIDAAKEALKKLRTGESGITSRIPLVNEVAAIAPHVKLFIQDLLEENISKLEDVVNMAHAEFKDLVTDLRKKDVLDIIGGVHDEKKQTRNDKAAQLRLLKREAQLLDILAKERKGEQEAKTEKIRVAKSRRIEELEEKIKEVRRLNKERIAEDEGVQENSDFKKSKSNAEMDRQRQEVLKKRVAKLEDDLKTKNFLKEEEPKPKLTPSKKTLELEDKVINLNHKIEVERKKDEYAKLSKFRHAYDKVMNVLGIKRVIQTAIDASIWGRQLRRISFNPRLYKITGKFIKAGIESVFSQKNYDRIMNEIHKSPDFKETLKDGIKYNELDAIDPNERNEMFQKSFIYSIPVVREPIIASQRIADASLNVARYELYQNFKRKLLQEGITRESDPKVYEDMAKLVMNMTGSGNMLKAIENNQSAQRIVGNTFYGAKLMASNINMLNPYYYFRMPAPLRLEAMKNILSYTSTISALALAGMAAGGKVSLNPDDSDFMQLRFGDKVYDLTGGQAAYIRTGLRIIEATVDRFTKSKHEANKAADFASTSTGRFIRNKLAPNTGFVYDMSPFGGGKNSIGQPVSVLDPLKVYPMYADDMAKAIKEDGWTSLLTTLLPNMVGIGYSNYNSEPNQSSLEDLIQRNATSENLDLTKVHKYDADGNEIPLDKKDEEKYIQTRDKKIKDELAKLYAHGYPELVDGKAKTVPFKEMTKEQIVKATGEIKKEATIKTKDELFPEPDSHKHIESHDKKIIERYKKSQTQ